MSSLDLAVTHLNAPYGKVVSKDELALALQHGTVKNSLINPKSSAIISSLFIEVSVNLIMSCIRESGATLSNANHLYEEAVANNMPRSKEWEDFVGVYV